jgi:hypothetical protein
MKATLPMIALVSCFESGAIAVDEPPPTCTQIREQIKAVTGLVVTPSFDLLRQIGVRRDCNFSSAEAYRAAYGDKPLPPQETHDQHDNEEQND